VTWVISLKKKTKGVIKKEREGKKSQLASPSTENRKRGDGPHCRIGAPLKGKNFH